MASPVRQIREERSEPKRPRARRRDRPVYRVEIAPGADPELGEELLLRWLADLLSE